MNIQAEKIELAQLLLQTEDVSVLEAIKNIFKSEKKDFWDELSLEQKAEIEEGEKQIERGEYVLYEAIMKPYR